MLKSAYISAAARCAPPENKPSRIEIQNCQSYLLKELALLSELKLILALGKIAFDATYSLLEERYGKTTRPRFTHGGVHEVFGHTVMSSYHPSRQNTQTGRLTMPMWLDVFATAKDYLEKAWPERRMGPL